MDVEELLKQYILCDGVIRTIHLDVINKVVKVQLAVRRYLSKKKWEACIIELELGGVTEVYLLEDFPTGGGYTHITITPLDRGQLYLSFDPFGNTGKPHEKDNWIIRASSLRVQEIH